MFAGGIADVRHVGVSRICAQIDDTTRSPFALLISSKILRHQESNGATVDRKVRVDTRSCRQLHAESLLRYKRGVKGFESTVGVVVNKNIHRPEFCFASVKQQRNIGCIAKISLP